LSYFLSLRGVNFYDKNQAFCQFSSNFSESGKRWPYELYFLFPLFLTFPPFLFFTFLVHLFSDLFPSSPCLLFSLSSAGSLAATFFPFPWLVLSLPPPLPFLGWSLVASLAFSALAWPPPFPLLLLSLSSGSVHPCVDWFAIVGLVSHRGVPSFVVGLVCFSLAGFLRRLLLPFPLAGFLAVAWLSSCPGSVHSCVD